VTSTIDVVPRMHLLRHAKGAAIPVSAVRARLTTPFFALASALAWIPPPALPGGCGRVGAPRAPRCHIRFSAPRLAPRLPAGAGQNGASAALRRMCASSETGPGGGRPGDRGPIARSAADIEGDCSVHAARDTAVRVLRASGVERGEAESAVDILLEHVTKLSRGVLRGASGKGRTLSAEEAHSMREGVARRAANEPVQYIVGEWDFYNLRSIRVRQPTLIPRPETEELVDMVVKSTRGSPPACFLEVGPGTGAISLALLTQWPGARGEAVELCQHAVALTEENAEMLGLSDRLLVHHRGITPWTQARAGCNSEGESAGGGLFDLLVSNPPYIPAADMLQLDPEVRDFEDHVALDGGEDGLDIVWEILRAAPLLLSPGASIWLEVDESHPQLLRRIFSATGSSPPAPGGRDRREVPGVEFVDGLDDMFGRPRFVHFRLSS